MRPSRRNLLIAASIVVLASTTSGGTALGYPDGQRLSSQSVATAIYGYLRDRTIALDREGDLERLYAGRSYAPLWLDLENRPTPDARLAADLIRRAAEHGLDSRGYSPDAVSMFARAVPIPMSAAAVSDVRLSLGLLRFYEDLHLGRANPRALGFSIDAPDHSHDFVDIVATATRDGRVRETAGALAPRLPQYERLRRVLNRYRLLVQSGIAPLIPQSAVVHPGDVYPNARPLRRLLMALEDFDSDANDATTDRYEGALVGAVAHFQRRHGLSVDGILGPKTQAALAVPLSWRIRQIELSLERLRWLPEVGDRAFIAVNVPMFKLWAWNAIEQPPELSMNVVVGRAIDTKTPVLLGEMEQIVFRPYWNVPTSIARRELLPAFERDPGRFSREHFGVVTIGERPVTVPVTPEAMAQVRRGALRLRQLPGDGNPLGLVKFVFPNRHDVYMHATVSPQLFGRPRRDFSHGCIRVEDPVALAMWVLNDPGRWPRDQVQSAMEGTDDQHVILSRPVKVLLFYLTAAVLPEDGELHFADDIYGYDRRLESALRAKRP